MKLGEEFWPLKSLRRIQKCGVFPRKKPQNLGTCTSNSRMYSNGHLSPIQARYILGDPNIVFGTNTKGEVCLSGGACSALSGSLGGHLAFTAQHHEALSMLHMACNMHLS